MAIVFPPDDKPAGTSAFPEHAVGTDQVTRCEPLLTPKKLVSRFLKGLPLISPLDNSKLDNDDLKDHILRAVQKVELETQVDVFPVQRQVKLPFDRHLYQSWVHLEIANKPILSLEEMTITTADGTQIFKMPNAWVETANFQRGIINVVPISPAFAAVGVGTSAAQGGAAFLMFIGQLGWVPAYWQLKLTSGWPEKKIPIVVNELIGIYAAIDILSWLASLHSNMSVSLSADGLGQSTTTAGPQRYVTRIQDLEMQKAKIIHRIKVLTGGAIVISNV